MYSKIPVMPLTKLLRTVKDGLVRYCKNKISCNDVNNMWILNNLTSLLSSIDQLDVVAATSVQTFDFSALYTSIPHNLLKSRISNLVHNAFRKKDGSIRYTHNKVTSLTCLLVVTSVMHETDDAYTIRSTCSCYWLEQFLN